MKHTFKTIRFMFLLLILTGLCAGGYFLFADSTGPEITLSLTTQNVSPDLPITITGNDAKSGIKRIQVVLQRGDLKIPIIEQTFSDNAAIQEVQFSLKESGIKDGNVVLSISATDSSFAWFGKGNTTTLEQVITIDSTPPTIAIKTSRPNVRRGGTGVILYSINKEVAQTGVFANNLFFPGFRQDNGDYVCFFAYPYNETNETFKPHVVAIDLAGNARQIALPVHTMHREFKHDTLAVTQKLLTQKQAEFSALAPHLSEPIEQFLYVNKDVRQQNTQRLLEIGRHTKPEILWEGAFMALPRGAVRAGFGDHRTYTWQGEKIDEQTHLGYDLASTAQAPIPAGNTGVILFAEYLGLYGNVVVIDHGLGIQSLYSHMTAIHVAPGDMVKKGDIIGTTGTSGMALGDHLHFGILVNGLEVSPVEWFDSNWLYNNISSRLEAAGGKAPVIEMPSKTTQVPQSEKAVKPTSGKQEKKSTPTKKEKKNKSKSAR